MLHSIAILFLVWFVSLNPVLWSPLHVRSFYVCEVCGIEKMETAGWTGSYAWELRPTPTSNWLLPQLLNHTSHQWRSDHQYVTYLLIRRIRCGADWSSPPFLLDLIRHLSPRDETVRQLVADYVARVERGDVEHEALLAQARILRKRLWGPGSADQ